MRFVGDIHGKVGRYIEAIGGAPMSLQVGDFGWGFGHDDAMDRLLNEHEINPALHKHIRGNHDNPDKCHARRGWLPDGAMWRDIFVCGGASSIDRKWRVEGKSWWPDEELSEAQLEDVGEAMAKVKPRTVVTHDAPDKVAHWMMRQSDRPMVLEDSRTRVGLQKMWEKHQPEVWVFGHWHMSWREKINGTLFVCLSELEVWDHE